MDEILAANFHVFHDVVEDEAHDLVVADEGWEIDHFLHENPKLKRAPTPGSPTSSAGCRCATAVRGRRP